MPMPPVRRWIPAARRRLGLVRDAILHPERLETREAAPARDAFADQAWLAAEVRSPLIFDIGAHRGNTVATYRALFPSARIYAFEPHPDSFCTLNSRFSRDPEVIPIACALSDRSSPRTLHVSKHHAAHSLLPRPRRGPKYFGHSADMVAQVSVESTSIDEFRREQGLSGRPIDILKMDIQGGERAGLEGARGTLARGAVSLVYTESIFVPHYEGGPLYHHIASQLEEFGYTLFGLYNFVHAENGQLRFGDAIFLSPSLRERVDGRLAEAR